MIIWKLKTVERQNLGSDTAFDSCFLEAATFDEAVKKARKIMEQDVPDTLEIKSLATELVVEDE